MEKEFGWGNVFVRKMRKGLENNRNHFENVCI
jgi:hypothetical protein